MRYALSSLVIVAAAVACQTGGDDSAKSAAPSEAALCGAGTTYENFAGSFFLNWCTGCHASDLGPGERKDAPPGVDFDTRAGIEKYAARIRLRAGVDRTMPPAGGPSDVERELLNDWIDCGMPGVGPHFDPGEPKYVEPPPMTDTRACAQERKPLPESVLPRCAPSTLTCRENCTATNDDGDAAEKCREACVKADLTPPVLGAGTAVNCESCHLLQLLACDEEVGCHTQVAALMCCVEDCARSGDAACMEKQCRGAVDAFGQCVYYRGEKCLATDGPYLGACYAK